MSKTKSRRTLVAAAAALALSVGGASVAVAQSLTHGAVQGVVKEKGSGDPLAGVTVVVTSDALQGTQSAISDSSGYYKITNLPPGTYVVTFYYGDLTVRRSNVSISANRTSPIYITMDTTAAGGEVIVIEDTAPPIDPTTTNQGITLDAEYLENVPVPGRTFEGVLLGAAGTVGDGLGVSFSGSTSLENQYVVDGVNTTGLTFGSVGSPLIRDFLEEVEILTGGYQAEYGRSTGGFINAVTKQGSNDFRGSVFSYFSSDFITADRKRTFTQRSSIESNANLNYDVNFGFDLGGPVIKDKLWFYVGFAPRLIRTDVTKTTKRRTDCRTVDAGGNLSVPANVACTASDVAMGSDGQPDEDPETGLLIFETLDEQDIPQQANEFQFVTKLNYAATPDHQGQITFLGTPFIGETRGVAGDPKAVSREVQNLTTDLSAKWTSKFLDSRSEVEAVFGWHRSKATSDSVADEGDQLPRQTLLFGNLGTWSRFGFESDATATLCTDSSSASEDLYPDIENCPDAGQSDTGVLTAGSGYAIGGIGQLVDSFEQRMSGRVSVKHRVDLLGKHEFKAGADIEGNDVNAKRQFSGGRFLQNVIGNTAAPFAPQITVFRFVQLAPVGSTASRFDDVCFDSDTGGMFGTPEEFACDFTPPADVKTGTLNWAAYLQDSWQVYPNVTLNIGLRYEEQRLRFAKHLRDQVDPLTGETRGKNAMVLKNMWAPRVGGIWDFTREGRSKVYGSWARFYESIPLNINNRSFGGETFLQQDFAPNQCGGTDPRIGAPDANRCDGDPANTELFGAGVLVAPDVKAQYLDEIVLGTEYEVFDNVSVGVTLRDRRLGRVLEDVSTDNAETFILANPGSFSDASERALQQQIDALDPMDPERQRLEEQLELFRGVRFFDEPRRVYQALELTSIARPMPGLVVQGSYVLSRTEGNFPGLFSLDNGQVDPNITSQFDIIELLANRDGPLPQDRRHQVKLEGYKFWDLGEKGGQLTTGARLRLLTGTPKNALGRHHEYGANEAFLLPRGARGRTDFTHQLDLHVSYGRNLTDDVALEFFFDVFRVFNNQDEFLVDQAYTFDNANPIVGGEYSDLVFLKQVDDDGRETNLPVTRNRNFGNVTVRFNPFSARLGARLTF